MIYMLTIFFMASSFTDANKCRFNNPPALSYDEYGNKVFTFIEKDKPVFHKSVLPKASALTLLRETVKEKTTVDQTELLTKQKAIFKKITPDLLELLNMYDGMINKTLGNIRPISCLEALLHDLHLTEQGVDPPSEFCAAIYKLSIDNKPHLKIIMITNPELSGPDLTSDLTRVNKGIWVFLHNHLFMFDNPSGVAGTVIPSGLVPPASFINPDADLKYYRKIAQTFGLEEAWITNGFDTSHFKVIDKNGDKNYWVY